MSRVPSLLAATVLLSACGGGGGGSAPPQSYPILVTAVGLAGSGLTLENGTSVLAVASAGDTSFQPALPDGTAYDVRVKTQPTQPWQTCSLSGNAGVVGGASPRVTVTCTTNTYAIGGTVAGLTGQDLVLANGVSTLAIATDGAFSFDGPLAVASGSSYSVSVKSQPIARSQTCAVSGGAGTVADRPVTAIAVSCAPDALGPLAGRVGGAGLRDGTGANARFLAPTAVATDAAGTLYVADENRVRKITPAGDVTTLAGTRVPGDADGSGAAAAFRGPQGVAIDASGTLFLADTYNHTIRELTAAGATTTLAGTAGAAGASDGFRSAAAFNTPYGVAVGGGFVYVADTENHTIRRITLDGVVTTFAGAPLTPGSADGVGSAARFNRPFALCVDSAGNVYVADTSNHTIRKITPAGVVTTVAGVAGNFGSADGQGAAARFLFPLSIALGADGKLVVADFNPLLRSIDSSGVVTTIAGAPGPSAFADGVGANARFSTRIGVATAGDGTVFVADWFNYSIRKVVGRTVTTFAGAPLSRASTDGPATTARLALPYGVVTAPDGSLYVTEGILGTAVRKISPNGAVTTIAGTYGARGSADGTGAAARFDGASAIALGQNGTLYVADTTNHTVRSITPAGDVTTLAGSPGQAGYVEGADARFNSPSGVAVDAAGNVLVSDRDNRVIRKIAPGGVVSTFASGFDTPMGLALDSSGYLYVADQGGSIRIVAPNGVTSTLAGASAQGFADGSGAAARFSNPTALTLDAANNVYVADMGNGRIRKVTPAGLVTTIAGAGYEQGVAPGPLPGSLNGAHGIAVLQQSPLTLAVTDAFENVVLHLVVPDI